MHCLPAGYLPFLMSGSRTGSPAVLRRARRGCPLKSRWETSRETDSGGWRWPSCRGWQRDVARAGMCSRTGCRVVCGGAGRRSPAGQGWIGSPAEPREGRGSGILQLHSRTDLWEGGTARGCCHSSGGGAWADYSCSPEGWEGKPGKATSTGMWRADEGVFQLLHEFLGFLRRNQSPITAQVFM